ncbi:MAG: Tryptophan synthase alpha chain, partial [Labilithrix sp.]|nr:Tryptophan synthase alpha chain [Labilithrix sp.]
MLLRKSILPIFLVFAWALSWGCAQDSVRLGEETPDAGSSPPSFTPKNDASAEGGPDSGLPEQLLECIGTECPAPFATCARDDGPSYKCGTDLSHDQKNCGACGNGCLIYKPLHMTSRCVDGACELECMNDPMYPSDRRNCNGEIDDGCEVDALTDPNNCGTCGKVCAAGEPCIKGKCGCTPPMKACNGECKNIAIDDMNCGDCGIECKDPDDACPQPRPRNVGYGCVGGTCGHLKCGGTSADCNGDVGSLKCASDGCEVDDIKTDRNN